MDCSVRSRDDSFVLVLHVIGLLLLLLRLLLFLALACVSSRALLISSWSIRTAAIRAALILASATRSVPAAAWRRPSFVGCGKHNYNDVSGLHTLQSDLVEQQQRRLNRAGSTR